MLLSIYSYSLRQAIGLNTWNPNAVRLQKATKGTGIGATSLRSQWYRICSYSTLKMTQPIIGCRELRVYFQDEQNVIREYRSDWDHERWWASLGLRRGQDF